MPDGAVPTSAAVRWAAGTALIAGIVFWVAMMYGDAAPQDAPSSISTPGLLTGWGLPISRVAADLAGFVTVGLLLAASFLLPAPSGSAQGLAAQAGRHASWASAGWAVAVAIELTFTISDLFFTPVWGLRFAESTSFMFETNEGRALVAQIVIAIAVALLSRWVLAIGPLVATLGLALLGIVPPALTGHSASSGSHMLAVASLLMHVLAASLWVGGLIALGWVATRGSRRLPAAVTRYSALAGWCIAIVAVSGVVNAAIRVEWFGQVFTTGYGNLLLAKTAAIVALGAFGWSQRRNAIPRLRSAGSARVFVALAATEILVMVSTVALAVALSRTPPPVPEDLYTDPVTELLGEPIPGAPSIGSLLTDFSPNGFGLVFVGLGSALYLAGVVVLRRRGDAWPLGRSASWFVGMVIAAWATFGGLGEYAHVLFSAHMVSHMLLSMVAPIFLVLAAPVTLALRALPGPREPGELSPRELLLKLLHSRGVAVLTHPVVAAGLFIASLYAMYFTGLFATLMDTHTGHAVMQIHFLAVGSLFYYVIVGVDPAPRRIPPLARFGVLLVSLPFHAFFSVAIMSSGTIIGESYWRSLQRPYQTDLLADQNLGGGISWAMGELPLIIVMFALFVQWYRSDRRESQRFDRQDDSALDDYNAYLASFNRTER